MGKEAKTHALEEMQKLYREEGINPMSGCLWSLIPFPILIALYSVIRQPITRMMFAPMEVVTTLQEYFTNMGYEIATGQYVTVAQVNVANYTCTGSGNVEIVAKA